MDKNTVLAMIIIAYFICFPVYIWYCTYQVNKLFWSKRNTDKIVPIVKSPKTVPQRDTRYEPRAGGKVKFKPVVKTDAILYQLENNPRKG
jgi:hypothetical protein